MLQDLEEKQKTLKEFVDVIKDLIENDKLETIGCFALCRGDEAMTFISIGQSNPLIILGACELLTDAVKQNIVLRRKEKTNVSD